MGSGPGEEQPGVGVAGLEAPTVPAVMQPFLDWEYWGIEYAVDVDEIFALPATLDNKDPRVISAKGDLEYNLRLGRNGGPIKFLRTLALGESFNPEDHNEGTVIIYNQETLSCQEADMPCIDIRKFDGQKLPKPPISLRLPVEHDTPLSPGPKQLIGGGYVYQVMVNCGLVVALEGEGATEKQLMTFDGTGIMKPYGIEAFKSGLGKIRLSRTLSRPRLESELLVVGEARAQNDAKSSKPRLIKINAMGVVA